MNCVSILLRPATSGWPGPARGAGGAGSLPARGASAAGPYRGSRGGDHRAGQAPAPGRRPGRRQLRRRHRAGGPEPTVGTGLTPAAGGPGPAAGRRCAGVRPRAPPGRRGGGAADAGEPARALVPGGGASGKQVATAAIVRRSGFDTEHPPHHNSRLSFGRRAQRLRACGMPPAFPVVAGACLAARQGPARMTGHRACVFAAGQRRQAAPRKCWRSGHPAGRRFVARGRNRSPLHERLSRILAPDGRAEFLGRSQVVRHRTLTPAFPGSNPGGPAISSRARPTAGEWVVYEGRMMVFAGNAHPQLARDIVKSPAVAPRQGRWSAGSAMAR
jgi:hypothetical protein